MVLRQQCGKGLAPQPRTSGMSSPLLATLALRTMLFLRLVVVPRPLPSIPDERSALRPVLALLVLGLSTRGPPNMLPGTVGTGERSAPAKGLIAACTCPLACDAT